MKVQLAKLIICAKCGLEKDSVEYITSFLKGTVESSCSACRAIRRKEGKLKRQGKPELERGWCDRDSYYRKRSNAIAKRKKKEAEDEGKKVCL